MTQLRLVGVRTVDLGKSDHRGLLATYAFGPFVFTVLSANAQATDSPADLRATIAKAASYQATFINWQEVSKDIQRDTIDNLPGYETVWPGGAKMGPQNAVPISYRPDVARFERATWHIIHRGLAKVSPTRGITEAVFELPVCDFTLLNIHAVNGVDGGGKAPVAWRRARHKKALAMFAALLAKAAEHGPAAGSGDFNTTRLRTLLPLPGALFDVPDAGTHGTRLIDWWVRPKSHAETEEKPVPQKRLTNLADALRAGGLKVVEVDGWKSRGRPASTGGFDPVGVLCHHTATGKSTSDQAVIRLLVNGRSDLPGPLCHLGLGRDGTVYVIAAGRANHAGKAKASGTVAAGDGNSLYIGIEAFNDGVGEAWPKVQYDAYVKVCAVLCQKITGNSAQTVRGHKETSVTGKIDPRFDMDQFRAAVGSSMRAPAPAAKQTPNITAAIRAKSQVERLAALEAVVARSSNPVARKAARAWHDHITGARAARAALKKQERK